MSIGTEKVGTIAALLAKAEGTSSAEEAEALTAKAEKLMLKYGIEAAMLADSGRMVTENIVSKRMPFKDTYVSALIPGFYGVCLGLNDSLKMYYTPGRGNNAMVTIVGFEGDVEIASMLLTSLQLQAATALRTWWKANRKSPEIGWLTEHQKWMSRRTFVLGFFDGAGDRLRESRKQAVKESGAGTDIVLASRKSRVDAWFDENGPTLRKGRSQKQSHIGQGAGYVAGQNADLAAGNKVGGGRKSLKG